MAKSPTLVTVPSGWLSATQVASNFEAINDAFQNTLSLDGSVPNALNADLDLSGNALLNVGELNVTSLSINGTDLTESLQDTANTVAADAAAAAASAAAAQAAENSLLEWQGPWVTATVYAPSDLVQESGNSYVCLIAHTSGTFATDLVAGKWEIFAAKGSPGAGTGDVLAANAGSEYVGVAGTFRNNISAMLRAITKRSGLNLATDTTIDSTIYNSDGTNTNGPTGNVDGDSFVSSKIDSDDYNYLWFGNARAWIGRRLANVNTWVELAKISDTRLTLATMQNASGTAVTFTGIPSGVREVIVMFDGVSLNGTDNILVQLGDAGGFETTGYVSVSGDNGGTINSTSGFVNRLGVAANSLYGSMSLTLMDAATFLWTATHSNNRTGVSVGGGGRKALSSELTQIRVTVTGGNSFDAGSVSIAYR